MSESHLQLFQQTGSESAFEKLVSQHKPTVCKIAFKITNDQTAVEEISQNVFMQLAKSANSIKEPSALQSWLATTTKNLSVSYVRREIKTRQARKKLSSNCLEPPKPNLPIADIQEALSSLPQKDRQLVEEHFIAGLTYRQIADREDISEAAAQKRVSRSIHQLRKWFSSRGVKVSAGALGLVLSSNSSEANTASSSSPELLRQGMAKPTDLPTRRSSWLTPLSSNPILYSSALLLFLVALTIAIGFATKGDDTDRSAISKNQNSLISAPSSRPSKSPTQSRILDLDQLIDQAVADLKERRFGSDYFFDDLDSYQQQFNRIPDGQHQKALEIAKNIGDKRISENVISRICVSWGNYAPIAAYSFLRPHISTEFGMYADRQIFINWGKRDGQGAWAHLTEKSKGHQEMAEPKDDDFTYEEWNKRWENWVEADFFPERAAVFMGWLASSPESAIPTILEHHSSMRYLPETIGYWNYSYSFSFVLFGDKSAISFLRPVDQSTRQRIFAALGKTNLDLVDRLDTGPYASHRQLLKRYSKIYPEEYLEWEQKFAGQ